MIIMIITIITIITIIMIIIIITIIILAESDRLAGTGAASPKGMPNLPTKIIPAKIRCLLRGGEFLTDMRVPPLKLKILLGSDPLKSRILVRRLAVVPRRGRGSGDGEHRKGRHRVLRAYFKSFRVLFVRDSRGLYVFVGDLWATCSLCVHRKTFENVFAICQGGGEAGVAACFR